MAKISASDVSKLRKTTGAGMMDCKKALTEAEGDFDKAIELIRKKGQAIANKRADREATEGATLAAVNADATYGAIVTVNCETDFVAKNDDFVAFSKSILDLAISEKPVDKEALLNTKLNGKSVADNISEQIAKIGEKLDLSAFETIEAEQVTAYIHPGNRIASLIGLNKVVDNQVGKDVAMQVAAMDPAGLDKDDVPAKIIEQEREIGRDQARQEGKPENLVDKIAEGKLNKFFKERTLLNQAFIKENKQSVSQYLKGVDKDLTVKSFKRFSLA